MFYWLFFGAIVVLVISIALADKFGSIAEMKGFSYSSYFWAVFFLGIIGMLMVAALPDTTIPKTSTNQSNRFDTQAPSYPSASNSKADSWTCTCGRHHQNYETSCICGVTKASLKQRSNQ